MERVQIVKTKRWIKVVSIKNKRLFNIHVDVNNILIFEKETYGKKSSFK